MNRIYSYSYSVVKILFAHLWLTSPKRFTEWLEKVENKLDQCESTNEYMGKVMLQNNKVMLWGLNLLASQAEKIREVNEELQTKRNGCEAARNSP